MMQLSTFSSYFLSLMSKYFTSISSLTLSIICIASNELQRLTDALLQDTKKTMLLSIHPSIHPMALWPSNFSILCCQLPVVTPATSGSTSFYTFFPFTAWSPHWSTASTLSFHSIIGYMVERKSLYMFSPLHSLNQYMHLGRQIWEFSLLALSSHHIT